MQARVEGNGRCNAAVFASYRSVCLLMLTYADVCRRMQVRVEGNGRCNAAVFASYWIINRTHEEAFVRVAPSALGVLTYARTYAHVC
jgi:hypothetical protein